MQLLILDIASSGAKITMPTQNSPYDAFSKLLRIGSHPCSPAELHGVLLGRSSTGIGFDAYSWLADVAELLETEPTDKVRSALIGLQEMVKGEFTSDDVTVVMLLPTDYAPLNERAAALGQWCQGFLHGFGVNSGCMDLSNDVKEVLHDLAAISHIQDTLEESEDGEGDYMEVMEYLRVVPLMLFTETKKTADLASIKQSALS